MKRRKNQAGFTILELLIVVGIILLLAAILLPKLLSARTTAIENAGAAATRSMTTSIVAYNAKYNVFPATLAALGGSGCATTPPTLSAACLLDNTIASSGLAGQYQFTYVINGGNFTLNADPVATSSAQRHYYADGDLTIRYADGAAASASSTDLGQ